MVANREYMKSPGLFASESFKQITRKAEKLFARGVYCLDLSKVAKALRQDVGFERALMLKEMPLII
jgi:hypothetical protein